jgi:hypothetical protein
LIPISNKQPKKKTRDIGTTEILMTSGLTCLGIIGALSLFKKKTTVPILQRNVPKYFG